MDLLFGILELLSSFWSHCWGMNYCWNRGVIVDLRNYSNELHFGFIRGVIVELELISLNYC
jgi:hypothetical protein